MRILIQDLKNALIDPLMHRIHRLNVRYVERVNGAIRRGKLEDALSQ